MTDPKIEAAARDAAYDYEQRRIAFAAEHRVTTPVVVTIFKDGYLAGHASRDEDALNLNLAIANAENEIAALRAKLEAAEARAARWEEFRRTNPFLSAWDDEELVTPEAKQ